MSRGICAGVMGSACGFTHPAVWRLFATSRRAAQTIAECTTSRAGWRFYGRLDDNDREIEIEIEKYDFRFSLFSDRSRDWKMAMHSVLR